MNFALFTDKMNGLSPETKLLIGVIAGAAGAAALAYAGFQAGLLKSAPADAPAPQGASEAPTPEQPATAATGNTTGEQPAAA